MKLNLPRRLHFGRRVSSTSSASPRQLPRSRDAVLKILVGIFFSLHFCAIVYWTFPSQLPLDEHRSEFAVSAAGFLRPILQLRQSLRTTALGSFARGYVRLWSLEQNWWLVSPNPPHESLELRIFELTREGASAAIQETLILHNLSDASKLSLQGSCERRPDLRVAAAIKKIVQPQYEYLLPDLVKYARNMATTSRNLRLTLQDAHDGAPEDVHESTRETAFRIDVVRCRLAPLVTPRSVSVDVSTLFQSPWSRSDRMER